MYTNKGMDDTFVSRHNLQLLRRRDWRIVERWFNNYCDPVYTFVFHNCGGDSEPASDIVRETFIRALQRIEQFNPKRGTMFAWLNWISRNCIKRILQNRGEPVLLKMPDKNIDEDMLRAWRHIATEYIPDSIISRQETAELVQLALLDIPDRYRKILRYRYYELKPAKEIAATAGIGENAVEVMLYSARQSFREAFLRLCRSSDRQGGKYE